MGTKGERYGQCESCDSLGHLHFAKSNNGTFRWICASCRAEIGNRHDLTKVRVDHLQAERFTSDRMLKAAPVVASSPVAEQPVDGAEKPTILVVEDDFDTRNAACAVLAVSGFNALPVENGKEGLDLLSKLDENPSLILLDLWMPIMDGWSFYEHVMRDRKLRSIPVIVLTAYDREVDVGSLKWLRKPIGMDTLIEAVRSTFTS
jgi:CheY-like chemotaxis protein